MYVVGLDGVGLDYSPTRLCLGLFFPSMVEMMMMMRRRKIIRKKHGIEYFLVSSFNNICEFIYETVADVPES